MSGGSLEGKTGDSFDPEAHGAFGFDVGVTGVAGLPKGSMPAISGIPGVAHGIIP
jgi:hypothetical protein